MNFFIKNLNILFVYSITGWYVCGMENMNKEQLAALIDGHTYRENIPKDILGKAKENGLVIVYGFSDDLMEIEGAIEDEGDCYRGADFLLDKNGLLPNKDSVELEDMEEYLKRTKLASKIKAVWFDKNHGPAWTFKTKIPHSVFNVIDDGEVQCKGIIFSIKDI